MRCQPAIEATGALVIGALLTSALPAFADYEKHPYLQPAERCANVASPLDCQRMIWDLPAASHVGFRAVAAEFNEDPIPRFGRGITDRVPPLYVEDLDGSGGPSAGDFRMTLDSKGVPLGALGFEQNSAGTRFALCPLEGQPTVADPNRIPWWAPVDDDADGEQDVGTDGLGLHAAGSASAPQTGSLFEIQCRRGQRVTYGPWVSGEDPNTVDYIAEGMIYFENTQRLSQIDGLPDADPNRPRLEWNVGTELYNHFGSHHGTCWNPTMGPAETCNDVTNTQPASAYEAPDGACWNDYVEKAAPGGDCNPEERIDHDCPGYEQFNQQFRNATQVPGRLFVTLPPGLAAPTVEDQVWACDHHTQSMISGLYGLGANRARFYNQKDFFPALDADDTKSGGVVGEIIFQLFTEAFEEHDYKIPSVMFDVVQDALTTWYTPFSYNVHQTVWYAPFDLAIGTMATHSHHRTVKSTMDILPANPLRPNGTEPACGGSAGQTTPPTNLYTNHDPGDARVCEYWKEKDGPVIVRKGQGVRTTCYVNNGVTPEAIKQGLVAGSMIEMAAEIANDQSGEEAIPQRPATVGTETWAPAVVSSPLGEQLWGTVNEPVNYRVKYQCGPIPGFSFTAPLQYYETGPLCPPNPDVDGDGDYVDGPYLTELCGETPGEMGWCNPSTIIFANRGEDEMCIGVFLYWPLDRVLNADGSVNEEWQQNFEADVNEGMETQNPDKIVEAVQETGTPGRMWKSPSDAGSCFDGDRSAGPHVEGVDTPFTNASNCRAGL